MGDRDLRGAQHMTRGMEHDRDIAQPDLLSIGHRLRRAREIISVVQPHDVERFRCRQHRPMAGPGMIRMAVGDDRAVHGPHRINVEAAGLAVQSGGIKHQDVVRAHGGHISGRLHRSSLGPPVDAGTGTGVDASSRRRGTPSIRWADEEEAHSGRKTREESVISDLEIFSHFAR